MAKSKTKKFASLTDIYQRARDGEVMARLCIIGALSNCGCDHLAPKQSERFYANRPKWERYKQGVSAYLDSLVCEYGVKEAKAEREILAEMNMARY